MPSPARVPGHLPPVSAVKHCINTDTTYVSFESPQQTINSIHSWFTEENYLAEHGSIKGLGMIQRGVYLEHHKDCDVSQTSYYTASLTHYLYSTPVSVTLSEEGDCVMVSFSGTPKTHEERQITMMQYEIKQKMKVIEKEMTSIDHIRKLQDLDNRITNIVTHLTEYKAL